MSRIRIHGLTLAFVLVLATAGGAQGPHWKDFAAHRGMNSKVKHYLGWIKALVNAAPTAPNQPNYVTAPTKASIDKACNDLLLNHHTSHTQSQSWCRIIVAYRLASRFHWNGCKNELTSFAVRPGNVAAWKDFVSPAIAKTVGQLLTDIKADLAARPPADVGLKAAIQLLITAREAGPHSPGKAWAEDYARIRLAYHFSDTVVAGDNATWTLCKNELDHPEPTEEESNK